MSAPVFIDPSATTAAVGDLLEITGAEARHAVTVQRREAGERVDVVDGQGTRASGVIETGAGDHMTVRVDSVTRDADAPVVLVQALAKGGRDEQAVESAVELGATAVIPWAASRSIVQWRGPKADKGRAKWQSVVTAATKQSRRARLATVEAVATTRELCSRIGPATANGERVLVLHEDADIALTALEFADSATPVWLIVGPEGGVSPEENDALVTAGATAVRLGPHVLRASSAGPAAIAALAAVRGNWNVGPAATTDADET
ncbi:16S rRNA (uracil(1498)-N(3))-methyltransferase [Demequina flava]|uniref:16S rRNA (uracil(1498)-N(3))-methyltransferase n=1 Tax=Demequina flava TaxID=1095025 RepID=UPI0007844DB8|nr:16S rRNA (uracil(1498)-N(3))-methyltransferase [Demequina flava]